MYLPSSKMNLSILIEIVMKKYCEYFLCGICFPSSIIWKNSVQDIVVLLMSNVFVHLDKGWNRHHAPFHYGSCKVYLMIVLDCEKVLI